MYVKPSGAYRRKGGASYPIIESPLYHAKNSSCVYVKPSGAYRRSMYDNDDDGHRRSKYDTDDITIDDASQSEGKRNEAT